MLKVLPSSHKLKDYNPSGEVCAHVCPFKEHSRNIRHHSGNIQGTFDIIQGTFRVHSGNIQGTFREHSGNIQHSENAKSAAIVSQTERLQSSGEVCALNPKP
jgi:hypothetical protein